MKCDVDIHKEVYANVVPLGGTAIFQAIVERVTNERTALAPSAMKIKTYALTKTSSLSALHVSVTLNNLSSRVFPSKKPADPRHFFPAS